MNRRKFLGVVAGTTIVAAGGTAGVFYVAGGNNDNNDNGEDKPQATVEDAPEAVKASKPLAGAFYRRIKPHFDEVHVYIRREGDIVMEYATSAESSGDVKAELHQIANEYANLVKDEDFEPKTLTVVTDQVQAIAPRPTVSAYARGDINQEGFLETVSITGGINRDGTNTDN